LTRKLLHFFELQTLDSLLKTTMEIAIMVAMSENRVIGNKGKVPWSLPNDLAHVHKITDGKPYIMGRESYQAEDAILSSDQNIILTRKKKLKGLCKKCEIAHSLSQAIDAVKSNQKTFLMGGEKIYEEGLEFASEIYLTLVHTYIDGDAFFPKFSLENWQLISQKRIAPDQKHQFAYSFLKYGRI
jgi:dihydrofolate reductase